MKSIRLLPLLLTVPALAAWSQATSQPPAGETRAQVKAETREAIRTGDIETTGDLGLKQNEVSPGLYPKKAGASAKPHPRNKKAAASAPVASN